MRNHHAFLTLVAIFACVSTPRAETTLCTPVTALPATISDQGIYCLQAHLSTNMATGNAITISVNNVTLDLNGWKVGGLAAGAGTLTNGIYSDAKNVTVKNGIVRGFYRGIQLNGDGAVVHDVLADQNTNAGIWVAGLGALIEHNQVVDTGGSTAFADVAALGINVEGTGSRISSNLVSGLTATGGGSDLAIYVTGDNTLVENNFVTDDAPPAGIGTSAGIYALNATSVGVIGNTLANFETCIGYSTATGIYARNMATGCTIAFSGGTPGTPGDDNASN